MNLINKVDNLFESVILEMFQNWEYKVPGDKSERLFDFYTLTALPASSNEDLEVARQEAVTLILDTLAKDMGDELLFAVASEFGHIFDRHTQTDIQKYFSKNLSAETMDFINKYGLTSSKRMPRGTGLAPALSKEPSGEPDRYRRYTRFLRAAGGKLNEAIAAAEEAFGFERLWNSSYGGKPWAQIAEGCLMLRNAKSQGSKIVAIDHAYDLQHNNDFVFDKLSTYKDKYGELTWLKTALETKKHAKNIYGLLDKTSDLKNFALAIMKNPIGGEGQAAPELEKGYEASYDRNQKEFNDAVKIVDDSRWSQITPDMLKVRGPGGITVLDRIDVTNLPKSIKANREALAIRDQHGRTLAHKLAYFNELPASLRNDPTILNMKDKEGRTVAQMYK